MSVTGRLLRRRALLRERGGGGRTRSSSWRASERADWQEKTAEPVGYGQATHEAAPLGCSVTRRVVDERGRTWRVREGSRLGGPSIHSPAGQGEALIFRCEEPHVPAEIRRTPRSLTALDNGDLLQLLRYGC